MQNQISKKLEVIVTFSTGMQQSSCELSYYKMKQFLSGDRKMTLTVGIKVDFTPQEVSEVIRAALEQNERVAKYKNKKVFGYF